MFEWVLTVFAVCLILPLYIAVRLGWEGTLKLLGVAIVGLLLSGCLISYAVVKYPYNDGLCSLQGDFPKEEGALCTYTCNYDTRPEITLPCSVGGTAFHLQRVSENE